MKISAPLTLMVLLAVTACQLGSHTDSNVTVDATGITITAGTPQGGNSSSSNITGSTWAVAYFNTSTSETLQLTSTVTPSNATQSVTWSCDATEGNVKVSSTGLVTVTGTDIGSGEASTNNVLITAKVGSFSATFTVNTGGWGG
jgi:hypothetical protein